jgi:hypothetical protein
MYYDELWESLWLKAFFKQLNVSGNVHFIKFIPACSHVGT